MSNIMFAFLMAILYTVGVSLYIGIKHLIKKRKEKRQLIDMFKED